MYTLISHYRLFIKADIQLVQISSFASIWKVGANTGVCVCVIKGLGARRVTIIEIMTLAFQPGGRHTQCVSIVVKHHAEFLKGSL